MSIESESDKILSSADDEILYDENIKRLLGDKSVLARILKGYVFECKDMSYVMRLRLALKVRLR